LPIGIFPLHFGIPDKLALKYSFVNPPPHGFYAYCLGGGAGFAVPRRMDGEDMRFSSFSCLILGKL